jgi:hypothetical protein
LRGALRLLGGGITRGGALGAEVGVAVGCMEKKKRGRRLGANQVPPARGYKIANRVGVAG